MYLHYEFRDQLEQYNVHKYVVAQVVVIWL